MSMLRCLAGAALGLTLALAAAPASAAQATPGHSAPAGVVIPHPDPRCGDPPPPPASASPAIGDGLNAASGGVIGTATGAVQRSTDTVSLVGDLFTTLHSWLADPGRMAHDVTGWLSRNTIGYDPDHPDCYRPTSAYGFARSVVGGDVQLASDGMYASAYRVTATPGILLVLLGGVGRYIRRGVGQDDAGTTILVDVIVRVVLGISGIVLGFEALSLVIPLCAELGRSFASTLLTGLGLGSFSGADVLGILLFGALTALPGFGLISLVLAFLLIWMCVKLLGLLLARFLVISFGIVFLPIIVALAVYDHQNRAARWWAGMMTGAAVIPIVTGGLIGTTAALAVRMAVGDGSMSGFAFGPLAATITVIGGIWLTNKAVSAVMFHDVAGGESLPKYMMRTAAHMGEAALAVGATIATGGAAASMLARAGAGTLSAESDIAAVHAAHRAISNARFVARPGRTGKSAASVSRGAAYEAFKGTPAGAALARQATPWMPTTASANDRWRALEQRPEFASALQGLRSSAAAAMTRTGRPEVPPFDAMAFVRQTQTTANPPEDVDA